MGVTQTHPKKLLKMIIGFSFYRETFIISMDDSEVFAAVREQNLCKRNLLQSVTGLFTAMLF